MDQLISTLESENTSSSVLWLGIQVILELQYVQGVWYSFTINLFTVYDVIFFLKLMYSNN